MQGYLFCITNTRSLHWPSPKAQRLSRHICQSSAPNEINSYISSTECGNKEPFTSQATCTHKICTSLFGKSISPPFPSVSSGSEYQAHIQKAMTWPK